MTTAAAAAETKVERLNASEVAYLYNLVVDKETGHASRAEPLDPPTVTVKKSRVLKTEKDGYVLSVPETVHFNAVYESLRPGMRKQILRHRSPETVVRELLEGQGTESYALATDDEAIEALRLAARDARLDGTALRRLSTAMFFALVIRAGGASPDGMHDGF